MYYERLKKIYFTFYFTSSILWEGIIKMLQFYRIKIYTILLSSCEGSLYLFNAQRLVIWNNHAIQFLLAVETEWEVNQIQFSRIMSSVAIFKGRVLVIFLWTRNRRSILKLLILFKHHFLMLMLSISMNIHRVHIKWV